MPGRKIYQNMSRTQTFNLYKAWDNSLEILLFFLAQHWNETTAFPRGSFTENTNFLINIKVHFLVGFFATLPKVT